MWKRQKPLVRRAKPVCNVDLDEATRILEESLKPTNSVPPNGKCQQCGKAVLPMRRLCGQCNAKHEFGRHNA